MTIMSPMNVLLFLIAGAGLLSIPIGVATLTVSSLTHRMTTVQVLPILRELRAGQRELRAGQTRTEAMWTAVTNRIRLQSGEQPPRGGRQ